MKRYPSETKPRRNNILHVKFETFAIENILSDTKDFIASFFRTSNGTEMDIILESGRKYLR